MRSPRIFALDVGAGHLACGIFSVSAAGRMVLQRFAFESIDSNPSREAHWNDHLAKALGAISAREKINLPAALAVPGHLALTKFVKTPVLNRANGDHSVRFEASQHIPYPLDEVVWNHVVIADDGFDLELMLAAVKLDAMQSLCAAADAAGFAVGRATPACLALRAGFRCNHPDAPPNVIVANLGARSSTLLFLDGERFRIRTLALAGNQVTQTLAGELGIDFAEAETLKISVLSGRSDLPDDSPARAAVQRAAAGFMSRLCLEITRSSLNHRRRTGAAQPAALYVTGGGSLISDLPAVLAARLKFPVERYDPFKRTDLSVDVKAAGAESRAPMLADLVGLAAPLLDQHVPEASLLPPALAESIAFRKRQPFFLGAAVFAAAALLPPVVYFNHRVATAQNHIAQIDAQLEPLRLIEARNADHLAQIGETKKQIAAIEGLVATRAGWINFIDDLQNRLTQVGDVWLEKITVLPPQSETVDGQPSVSAGVLTNADPRVDSTQPETSALPVVPPLKLALSGRLLDVANPISKVSAESYERAKKLLMSFTSSAFVATVENERFDNSQPGLLRFDCTLVVNSLQPL